MTGNIHPGENFFSKMLRKLCKTGLKTEYTFYEEII